MRRPSLSRATWRPRRQYALATRAMLPSALSVSPLLVGSVHYEIRLFGLLKALQSSDRSLLLDEGGLSSLAQSPLELRNDRVTYASAARVAVPGSSPPLFSGRRLIVAGPL